MQQPDLNSFPEDELLRLVQQGNTVAFEFLYRRHSAKVYALCQRMVKNPAQAEDLTQETFIAVLRGIQEFRGQAAFSTWLHQVARNTALMALRKKRIQETSLEEIAEANSKSGRVPVEFGMRDRRLEGTPDRMMLQRAVAKLSSGFRQALLLHDVHGYEHREIATMMGCALGTSKSQLHKARLRIRQFLKKCFPRYKRTKGSGRGASGGTHLLSVPRRGSNRNNERQMIATGRPRERRPSVSVWCELANTSVPTEKKMTTARAKSTQRSCP